MSKCQPGRYPVNSTNVQQWCEECLSGCEKCDNKTTCYKCKKGLVLDKSTGVYQCIDACPSGYYSDASNICQSCISGCKRCANNNTCLECDTGKFLVEGPQNCVAACVPGFYSTTGNCYKCRSQCRTCSSATTCDSCIVGYKFASSQCEFRCGKDGREDDEECDDGNNDDGDGCDSSCKLEPGYVCMPLDQANATSNDVCFCDPSFKSAEWTSFWGAILIQFDSNIVFNTDNGAKSSDAFFFCSQILDEKMFAKNADKGIPLLGTDYSCFLDASATSSSIRILVDLDSTLGNNAMNFSTTILLKMDALRVKDCPASIPLIYTLTNLPLDSPIVYFQSSLNDKNVPMCASYWGLNIFTSKGFTKRDVAVTWTVVSVQPETDATGQGDLKAEIATYLDANYKDVKYFELLPEQIERLSGRVMIIKVTVTNFLGI